MSVMTKMREDVGPMGHTLFGPIPGTSDWYILWLGRGSSLKLAIRPFSHDGTLVTIDHPTADGVYMDRTEARRAAHAFVAVSLEVD